MHWPKSETWFFQFQGQNQVQFYDQITNTRWMAYRATMY
jgi:hypothetical protein